MVSREEKQPRCPDQAGCVLAMFFNTCLNLSNKNNAEAIPIASVVTTAESEHRFSSVTATNSVIPLQEKERLRANLIRIWINLYFGSLIFETNSGLIRKKSRVISKKILDI